MAIQLGVNIKKKLIKGHGVLLGDVPRVAPGRVMALGSGVAGIHAKMAAGLGANATIMDINMK